MKKILSNFDFISSLSFYMLEKIKLNTSKNNKLFYLPILLIQNNSIIFMQIIK